MSFSSGSGRSSFNKKGFSGSQKKERKKKQEFHKHKIKFAEGESHLDFEQMKSRVSVALDKLGHQVFSLEPGGYTFQNWMTSFNLLLDDFEDKASGFLDLPKEYHDSRQRLGAELLNPVDVSDLDTEVQNLESEIQSIKLKVSETSGELQAIREKEQKETLSKIDDLKEEESESAKELEGARNELELRKKARKSFFSRLFSNSLDNSSIESAQSRLDSIRARKEALNKDLRQLQNSDKSSTKDLDEELSRLRDSLTSLQQRLGELEAKRLERLQLTEKRAQATAELSAIISSLRIGVDRTTITEGNDA